MFPNADIPTVQLSLREDLDPARHIELGRALAPLRDRGVLIVGSGMSYHNLGGLFRQDQAAASERFDTWLAEAATAPDPKARDAALTDWERAPSALDCHPRAEHLLPLMVAAGAAGGDIGRRVYQDRIVGKALSGFQFG
jgi:aromatic ring-opening dioxygenase catalytic subunit (LigB family)